MLPNPFSVRKKFTTFTVEKVAQKLGYFCCANNAQSKKHPK
jgi:hypothetical protein